MFPPSSHAQIALEYYVYVLLSDQVRVTGVKPFWKRWVSFIYVKWLNMFASLHLSINQQKTDQQLMWRLGQEINIHQHSPPNWQGLTCVSPWHYRRPRLTDGNVHHQDDLCAHDPLVWGRHRSSSCHRIRDWGSSLRWASTSFHPFCSLVVPEVRYCLALTHTEHSSHQIH